MTIDKVVFSATFVTCILTLIAAAKSNYLYLLYLYTRKQLNKHNHQAGS